MANRKGRGSDAASFYDHFGKHSHMNVRADCQPCLMHFVYFTSYPRCNSYCINISSNWVNSPMNWVNIPSQDQTELKTSNMAMTPKPPCGRSPDLLRRASVSSVTNSSGFKLVWPIYKEPVSDMQHNPWLSASVCKPLFKPVSLKTSKRETLQPSCNPTLHSIAPHKYSVFLNIDFFPTS